MRTYDLLWIEDDFTFQDGILFFFKGLRDVKQYSILPWLYESLAEFDESSHLELQALPMTLVAVDYNLPGGINGDEIIRRIRSHEANNKIKIIFYSASHNIEELKSMANGHDNIIFSQKSTLREDLQSFFDTL